MKIFGLKNCDTCRKAFSKLNEKGFNVEFIDIRLTPLNSTQVKRFLEVFGCQLINKRSTTWRKLTEAEKMLPIEKLIELSPTVIKRPIIECDALFIGWNREVETALEMSNGNL
jgi:Spx/MgsR family transcriptional regulator